MNNVDIPNKYLPRSLMEDKYFFMGIDEARAEDTYNFVKAIEAKKELIKSNKEKINELIYINKIIQNDIVEHIKTVKANIDILSLYKYDSKVIAKNDKAEIKTLKSSLEIAFFRKFDKKDPEYKLMKKFTVKAILTRLGAKYSRVYQEFHLDFYGLEIIISIPLIHELNSLTLEDMRYGNFVVHWVSDEHTHSWVGEGYDYDAVSEILWKFLKEKLPEQKKYQTALKNLKKKENSKNDK